MVKRTAGQEEQEPSDVVVENGYMKMWKKDGIIYLTYADNALLNIAAARECVEARLKFSEGLSYPCLIDMPAVKGVTKEAREYFATEGAKLISVCGLITGNAFTRTLAHVFLTVNKPPVPIRLFGDSEAKKMAIAFCPSYMNARELGIGN